jgi:uncharacterized membrane protein YbhN (UPF0104 family)
MALVASTPINAARWHCILSARNESPGFRSLFLITLVGLFFNQVLPTGVGGDAVRAWRCRMLGMRLGIAVRSILLDRAAGYATIVILGIAGLPVLLHTVSDGWPQQVFALVLAAGGGGLALLFCIDLLPAFLFRLNFMMPLAMVSVEARQLVRDRRRIAIILGLSMIGLVLNVSSYEWIGRSVGARLSFLDWLVIVPPVTLIQLLPVSLAGWGVREVALVAVMSAFGTSTELAIATSLLFGVCQIINGLPGGLVWLANWDVANTTAIVAARTTSESETLKDGRP